MKKKVLLRAPLLTNSGYGVHSRQIFEWLEQKENIDLRVDCLRWGHCPWIISPDGLDGLAGRIMSKAQPFEKHERIDISFQNQLPNEWDPNLAAKNIGISAFVETDRCNSQWIDACNKMDHIVVPSSFTKDVVTRSGQLNVPITVVPEWYNHALLNKSSSDKIISKDKRFQFNTSFNVMVMGLLTSVDSIADRKNLANTLVWLFEAFSDKKDVGIILKTSLGKDGIRDRKNCEAIIQDLVGRFRKSPFPRVHLIHGNLQPKEMAALYKHKSVKLFVSATRGEGYGLPLIDAAVSGVPVVATDWSGHFEFLERELIYPVDYSLSLIPQSRIDGQIFLEGFQWAEPKKESFQNQVVSVYNNYSDAKSKASKLKKKVTQRFHKKVLFEKYDEVVGKNVL